MHGGSDCVASGAFLLLRDVAGKRSSHGQLSVGGGTHGVAVGVLGGRRRGHPLDTFLAVLRP